MQFYKKTRSGALSGLGKLLIKIIIVGLVFFIAVVLIDRIDFPSPNKKIEKIVPNENLRIIK
tara:strand:- start:2270 stop:2455 length:186 start_codon:yes stop_codon:yes gene_type:complete